MKVGLLVLFAGACAVAGCNKHIALERELSSFEVTLSSPVGTPEHRCPLPGTSTAGADLTGCPRYEKDANGDTVVRAEFVARAVDNRGQLLEDYSGLASISVVPGHVEPGLDKIRFHNGVATGAAGANPFISFRAAFGDTFVWLTDDRTPARATDTPGLGIECGSRTVGRCSPFGLSCVNTTRSVGFDPNGLSYCTSGCVKDSDCSEGYFCGKDFFVYDDAAADTSHGACVRRPPTYSSGVAGPVYLIQPTLADVQRSDSLLTSPFNRDFVAVTRGKMVVTAVRIDGFYVSDVCPRGGPPGNAAAAAPLDDPDCTDADRQAVPEFNHLFVFNFSRPDDLAEGDELVSVSGPIGEFNGYTELNFPLWEVNVDRGSQPLPPAISLHDKIADHWPELLAQGERCYVANADPASLQLLDCDYAMERLESARISVTTDTTLPIMPGSPELTQLNMYGQWPITVSSPKGTKTFQMITRDNIPFFDPIKNAGKDIHKTVTGNLRQVAFDETSDPIWIVEPKDQGDCAWCQNP